MNYLDYMNTKHGYTMLRSRCLGHDTHVECEKETRCRSQSIYICTFRCRYLDIHSWSTSAGPNVTSKVTWSPACGGPSFLGCSTFFIGLQGPMTRCSLPGSSDYCMSLLLSLGYTYRTTTTHDAARHFCVLSPSSPISTTQRSGPEGS